MLLFPDTITSNIFQDDNEHTPKILQVFDVAMQRGINVKILTPEETLQRIGKLIAREDGGNEKRELLGVRRQGKIRKHLFDTLQRKRLQTRISFLIVDSKVSLVEELKAYNSPNGELSLGHLF